MTGDFFNGVAVPIGPILPVSTVSGDEPVLSLLGPSCQNQTKYSQYTGEVCCIVVFWPYQVIATRCFEQNQVLDDGILKLVC